MTLRTTESSKILSGHDSDRLLWPCPKDSGTFLGIRLDLGVPRFETNDLPRLLSFKPSNDVKSLSNAAMSSTFEGLGPVGVLTPEFSWLDNNEMGVLDRPIE